MKSFKTLLVLLIALTVATTASAYNFTKDLELGARGSDVTKLQEMLVGAGHLESDSVTGYFGPATELAVAKWQIANDVKPISGIFGAISRAISASVPVANLSADISSYQTTSFLTPDQAKYAVNTLVKAKLISSSKSNLAFNLLVSGNNPQIPIMKLNPHVSLLGIKDSGLHGFEAEAAVPTDSIKTWMYTFSHDGLVKITPEGRDVLEDGNIYFPRNNGESFNIKFTADNLNPSTEEVKMIVRGYSSSITSHNQDYLVAEGTTVFKVSPRNNEEELRLTLEPNPNKQLPEYFKAYTLKSPNDSGKVIVWKISVDCTPGVLFSSRGQNDCGQEFISRTNGNPLNEDIYFKNTSQTETKTAVVNVWTYSRFEATTPETGSQYQLQSGKVSVRLAPGTDVVPPVVTPAPAKPVKLTSGQLCAAIKMTTADSCAGYTSYSQRQNNPTYTYNGVTYNLSYTLNKNAAGAKCNDLCSAVAK